MRQVNIFRAQGIRHEDNVDEVTITIAEPMPDLPADKSRSFFASEGAALAEAIWASCPGGTVDAAITALLTRRASELRVPFPRRPS